MVNFGGSAIGPGAAGSPPDPATLQALLDLGGPGGVVVLLGTAARDAAGLAALLEGVHFVGVNPPASERELATLSLLCAADSIPLRSQVARAVVVGAEVAGPPWLAEAVRVLLPGRRLVVEREVVDLPPGLARLAAGDGLWVGEKR